MIFIAIYNASLVVLDASWVVRLRRDPRASVAARVLLELAIAGTLLAAVLGSGSTFRAFGLLAWGVFVHGPFLLVSCALALREASRATSRVAAVMAAAVVGIGIYAFAIEPFRLEVTEYRIASREITAPLRVVLVADLQTDRVGKHEQRALERVMELEPDLIVLSGDYLQIRDRARRRDVREELRAVLRELQFQAPLGVVAVAGNIDSADWPLIFEGFPVHVVESTKTVEMGEIAVTALGLWASFDTGLEVAPSSRFHVVVGHSPDYALGDVRADLLLAGHTHGGQVQLPVLGPPMTLSRVPRSWASGRTELDPARSLIVSRGVGMERGDAPRLRFLCRPELVVIDLVPDPAFTE